MDTLLQRSFDPTNRILGPDGRPYYEDAPAGLKLPPVWTFGGLVNTVSKTYSYRWDEAYKKSRENAIAMRNDCFLMGLLRERQLPTEQMRWHIEPEDKRDPRQIEECAFLEKVVRRMPYSHNYNRAMGEALWYGRGGPQQALSRVDQYGDPILIDGEPAVIVSNHSPVNGDKIQFDWDGTPKIRIYPGAWQAIAQAGGNVQIDDIGPVLALDNPYWRSRFVIHRHDVIDADFYDINSAGQVGGIGIRGYIYWLNWLRLEVLSWMQDFMERTGLGLTIYYYDAANKEGLAQAQAAAAMDGRNTIICWPRSNEGKDQGAGIERVETNCTGMDALFQMVDKTFESKIERFMIGQTLSSGTEGSGLGGSGVADMHGDTKFRIIKSDCENQADTRTEQLVRVLQKLNPKTAKSPYRYTWVYNVDDWDPMKKLQAAEIAYGMGVDFSKDELREPTGFSKPNEDDEVVQQFDPSEYHLLNAQARASGKKIPIPGIDGANGSAKTPPKKPTAGKASEYARSRLDFEFYEDMRKEKLGFFARVKRTVKAGEERIEQAVKKFFDAAWNQVKKAVDYAFGRVKSTQSRPGADGYSPGLIPSNGQAKHQVTLPPATEADIKAIVETVQDAIEPEKLKEAVKPHLERMHTAGMGLELDDNVKTRIGSYSGRQIWDQPFSQMKKKLPLELRGASGAFLEKTFQQPWWDKLPGDVGAQLGKTLSKGTNEGETIEGLAARLQNAYADLTTVEAIRMARTMTTGSLNAGLQDARIEQYRKGLVKSKRWESMEDEDVRHDHDEADGQEVGVADEFTVGGERCQYPGDDVLSPAQKFYCRCIARSVPVEPEPYSRNRIAEYYEGRWVTMNGEHVYIENGKITKGPAHLTGLSHHEGLRADAEHKHKEKMKARRKAEHEAGKDKPEEKPSANGHAKKAETPPAKGSLKGKSPATHMQDAKKTLTDIAKAHIREKSVGIAFDQLYAQAKAEHPDLSKEDFRVIMKELHEEGSPFRLGGWPHMHDDLPDPDLTVHVGGSKNIGPRDQIDRSKPRDQDETGKVMWYLNPSAGDQHYSRKEEAEGHWVTIHGEHVYIEDGKITKGPANLQGKNISDLDEKAPSSGNNDLFRKPKNEVKFVDSEDKVKAAWVKATRGNLSLEKAPFLVGAPDDAKIAIAAHGDEVKILVDHPDFSASRRIGSNESGETFIENVSFNVRDQGKGLGAEIFANQVDAASRRGVAFIQCDAAGDGGADSGYNGYYTWPRLGYDLPLNKTGMSGKKKAEQERLFPEAKTVLDIFQTKKGRDWWKTNGISMNRMKFDLKPGSRSMKVLAAYQKASKKSS